jgi:hypothetical protein
MSSSHAHDSYLASEYHTSTFAVDASKLTKCVGILVNALRLQHEVAYEGSNPYVLLRNFDPKQECHFQVAATNDLGQGAFSEYANFRSAVKGSLDEVLEACPWCEVNLGSQRKVYVNVQSGKEQSERPLLMDGPVDKIAEFRKKRFRFLRTLLMGAEQSPIDCTRLNVDRACLLEASVDQVLGIQSDCLAKRIKVSVVQYFRFGFFVCCI